MSLRVERPSPASDDQGDVGASLLHLTSGRCRSNGVDVHFWRTGGAKPSLVALHGLMGSGACLSPLASALDDHFDVILPDARGHGRSSAPASGYAYASLAADVIGLIATLDLDAPILLGHSMGGLTAAVVASMSEPLLSGLILVDPTFISPEWQREAFASGVADDHRHLLTLARSDLLARARERSPNRSADMIDHLVDARLQTCLGAFEILAPPNPDFRELARRFSVPTLLVLGERGVVSLETAAELRLFNPLIHIETIADVGHGLPYDEPGRVGEAALAFLRGLDAREMTSGVGV